VIVYLRMCECERRVCVIFCIVCVCVCKGRVLRVYASSCVSILVFYSVYVCIEE
jgi:hypothetical protein